MLIIKYKDGGEQRFYKFTSCRITNRETVVSKGNLWIICPNVDKILYLSKEGQNA